MMEMVGYAGELSEVGVLMSREVWVEVRKVDSTSAQIKRKLMIP